MKWTCTSCHTAVEVPNGAAFHACAVCGGSRWMTDEVHVHTAQQVADFAGRLSVAREKEDA